MKYNGIDPTKLHHGISIAKEIPPGAPTSQLETLSGSTGEIIAGRTIKSEEYTVRINIAAKSRQEAWNIRSILAEWACPMDEVTHPLNPTHWPRRAYDAIFKEISPPEFTFGFATIDVTFTIPRPIAYDAATRTASKADADGSGVTLSVNVMGSSYIRPALRMTAKAGNRMEVGAESKILFAVNYDFAAGDVVEVQMDPPAVWITHAGGEKTAADQHVDYTVTDLNAFCRVLMPGMRKITSGQASRITATWRDEYL